jgi:hypothetical protein
MKKMVYQFNLRPAARQVWWSKSREEPGAHKQRHPNNQYQIRTFGEKLFGENRVDTIFRAGFLPCSFFSTWRYQAKRAGLPP